MNDIHTITYRFKYDNDKEKEFCAHLNNQTLEFKKPEDLENPQWTKLDFNKCTICLLRSKTHKYCPVATNIWRVINIFESGDYSKDADIVVETDNREFRKRDTIEKGLSSLIGLVMVTSGCPFLDKLRPMAYTHLPFATPRETTYRAVSMYLLAQYFLQKRGKRADWRLKKLVKIYADIRVVNQCFTKRIQRIDSSDANVNSLVRLDCFATVITLSLVSDWWDEIEAFFNAYLT